MISFGLLQLAVLFGLIAVLIPPLIHLFSRRRYDVVEWGAMQFLEVSSSRRRRLRFEELLLMLLRMGLIALLVLALAAPFAEGQLVAQIAERPRRNVVLVIDGSASMRLDDGRNLTPHDAAKEWSRRFLDRLAPGDGVSLVWAGAQPAALIEQPAEDLQHVRAVLDALPEPAGSCDGPLAVFRAVELLRQHGRHAQRDIIVLTDGQRHGWADAEKWKNVAAQLRPPAQEGETPAEPRVWFVDLRSHLPSENLPNLSLAALEAGSAKAWVGHPYRVTTTLSLTGRVANPSYLPYHLRLEVDGKVVEKVPLTTLGDLKNGSVSVTFAHTFARPGSHLLSVVLRPDWPREKLLRLGALADVMPADSRCDIAVQVWPTLPVLLVDGDDRLSTESSTFFLRKAFAETAGPDPAAQVLVRAVPAKDFHGMLLGRPLSPGDPETRPAVLILSDVPRLTAEQQRAVEEFLARGGGVLVALGKRIDMAHYNEELFRGGDGWLPARLSAAMGDPDAPQKASSPDVKEFQHPALEVFRRHSGAALAQAKFPRWWKAAPAAKGATVGALLTSGDPLLIEAGCKKGRVLVCAVPLDRSWGSNLPTLAEYPVLVHELIYHLASAERVAHNVAPGQPLVYAPPGAAKAPASVEVLRPDGKTEHLLVDGLPFTYTDTALPGVYHVRSDVRDTVYYVVEPDRRESNLTPLSEADREMLRERTGLRFTDDPHEVIQAALDPAHREDLWWLLMLGVIGLLCFEVALTRRMSR